MWVLCFGPGFVIQFFVVFIVLQSFHLECVRAGCFNLIVFMLLYECLCFPVSNVSTSRCHRLSK